MKTKSKLLAGAALLGLFVATGASLFSPASYGTGGVSGYGVDQAEAREELQLAQADAGLFPGGATSVRETYQAWQVVCGASEGAKQCRMVQEQRQRETRQRILAVELQSSERGLDGLLVLPFGLALSQGVNLRVDGTPVQEAVPFKTCLPSGCVVSVSFDHRVVDLMARGAILSIEAAADEGGGVEFQVSLSGFSAAKDRIVSLLGAM